jgi:hypothetical protein
MNPEKYITAFVKLGKYVEENPESLQEILNKTYVYNSWFTKENTQKALQNIASEFLAREKLENWLADYSIDYSKSPKVIAIVAAGNIPMVAFHDILCILISGNALQLKLSEKDKFLLPHLLDKLVEFEPDFRNKISIQQKLEKFDAIIATGSNQAAKHFTYYFSKYKHIIRKHRNAIAVLTGKETEEEIRQLGADIFDYFGLGCRNVSKLFVPKDFELIGLKNGLSDYKEIMQHNQYMNNLDYQRTLYLMNQTPLLDIDFVNIVENDSLHSPISCLHVQRYTSMEEVENSIQQETDDIQCIVGKDYLPFGKSQQPSLRDYADNIDTLKFITEL